MNRVIRQPLCNLPPVGGHQCAGKIMAFVNDRRIGRMNDVRTHFVHDSDQRLADKFKLHEIFQGAPDNAVTFLSYSFAV
jgi:hypothetical protein